MMMKGDRKKMSMVGEAHLHNDRDQLAPSPARARCGPCGVLVHIALLAHFEMVHIVHIILWPLKEDFFPRSFAKNRGKYENLKTRANLKR